MSILKFIFPVLALSVCLGITAYAEEGGSGHYLPGSMASFVDGVPGDPTFIVRINYINYTGSTDINRSLPIAGVTALNVDARGPTPMD